MKPAEWIACPHCDGGIVERRHPWFGQASCPSPVVDVTCDYCEGVGEIIKPPPEPEAGFDEDGNLVWRLN